MIHLIVQKALALFAHRSLHALSLLDYLSDFFFSFTMTDASRNSRNSVSAWVAVQPFGNRDDTISEEDLILVITY